MLLFYINSILMFYPKICFRKQVEISGARIKLIINVNDCYKEVGRCQTIFYKWRVGRMLVCIINVTVIMFD
jgi:hypothetical protein